LPIAGHILQTNNNEDDSVNLQQTVNITQWLSSRSNEYKHRHPVLVIKQQRMLHKKWFLINIILKNYSK